MEEIHIKSMPEYFLCDLKWLNSTYPKIIMDGDIHGLDSDWFRVTGKFKVGDNFVTVRRIWDVAIPEFTCNEAASILPDFIEWYWKMVKCVIEYERLSIANRTHLGNIINDFEECGHTFTKCGDIIYNNGYFSTRLFHVWSEECHLDIQKEWTVCEVRGTIDVKDLFASEGIDIDE